VRLPRHRPNGSIGRRLSKCVRRYGGWPWPMGEPWPARDEGPRRA
jgi:hypothetical protein